MRRRMHSGSDHTIEAGLACANEGLLYPSYGAGADQSCLVSGLPSRRLLAGSAVNRVNRSRATSHLKQVKRCQGSFGRLPAVWACDLSSDRVDRSEPASQSSFGAHMRLSGHPAVRSTEIPRRNLTTLQSEAPCGFFFKPDGENSDASDNRILSDSCNLSVQIGQYGDRSSLSLYFKITQTKKDSVIRLPGSTTTEQIERGGYLAVPYPHPSFAGLEHGQGTAVSGPLPHLIATHPALGLQL